MDALPKLRSLILEDNDLQEIPHDLHRLTKLNHFDVRNNKRLGSAAHEYANQSLANLGILLREFETGGSAVQDTVKVMLVGEG